jgi:hypothetical protein
VKEILIYCELLLKVFWQPYWSIYSISLPPSPPPSLSLSLSLSLFISLYLSIFVVMLECEERNNLLSEGNLNIVFFYLLYICNPANPTLGEKEWELCIVYM